MCRRHCRLRQLQPNLWESAMSLLKYAIAAAIGYYAGQPGGRRQIQQLGQKATELVKSPKAAELKDRSRELVGERASAAVDKVRRKTTDDSTSSGATTTTGTATAGSASVTTPVTTPSPPRSPPQAAPTTVTRTTSRRRRREPCRPAPRRAPRAGSDRRVRTGLTAAGPGPRSARDGRDDRGRPRSWRSSSSGCSRVTVSVRWPSAARSRNGARDRGTASALRRSGRWRRSGPGRRTSTARPATATRGAPPPLRQR